MLIKVDEAPQGWSYMTMNFEPPESKTSDDWVQAGIGGSDGLRPSLLSLGDDGWELVTVVPFTVAGKTSFKAFFKQPQFPTEAQPEPKQYTMTVGKLRDDLKLFPDDFDLFFGDGTLEFYRVKERGEKLVQIEFNQMTDMVPDVGNPPSNT
jgi:hypothetical protein